MSRTFIFLLILFFCYPVYSKPPAFADIHIHFNWDQKETISAQQVIKRLYSNNVAMAVVSSTPSSLALELARLDKNLIVPIFSPYINADSRNTWFLDENVLRAAKQGLANNQYFGIGELHLWSGMRPRYDNEILQGLLKLAQQFDVPFLIHTEASNQLYLKPICTNWPKVRFLWAHAGGTLNADSVEKLMIDCSNLWVEVSARDPWRYNTLVNDQNQLLPGWHDLFLKFPDRFMTGTDPVWSVRKGQRWDEPDEGWEHYDQILEFHREWLKQLPNELEERIRLKNARQFFKMM